MATLIGIAIIAIIGWVSLRIKANADENRIIQYLERNGCEILSLKTNPFVFGWFSKDSHDYYTVVYKRNDKKIVCESCKSSLVGGVQFFKTKNVKYCISCFTILTDDFYTQCPDCGGKLKS